MVEAGPQRMISQVAASSRELDQEIFKVFSILDKNEEGCLTTDSLNEILPALLQTPGLICTKEDSIQMHKDLDKFSKGPISWENFRISMHDWLNETKTFQLIQSKYDAGFSLTQNDIVALHNIIAVRFMVNKDEGYANSKIVEHHTNLWFDILPNPLNLNAIKATNEQKDHQLSVTASCLNEVNLMKDEINTDNDITLINRGLGRFKLMMQITKILPLPYERRLIPKILEELYKLVLNDNLIYRLTQLLEMNENIGDLIAAKLSVLEILSELSCCGKMLDIMPDGNFKILVAKAFNIMSDDLLLNAIQKRWESESIMIKHRAITTIGDFCLNDIDMTNFLYQGNVLNYLMQSISEQRIRTLGIDYLQAPIYTLTAILQTSFRYNLHYLDPQVPLIIHDTLIYLFKIEGENIITSSFLRLFGKLIPFCSMGPSVHYSIKAILEFTHRSTVPEIIKEGLIALMNIFKENSYIIDEIQHDLLKMIEIRIFDGHLEHDIKVMCLDMALLIAKNGNKNKFLNSNLLEKIPMIFENKIFKEQCLEIIYSLSSGGENITNGLIVVHRIINTIRILLPEYTKCEEYLINIYKRSISIPSYEQLGLMLGILTNLIKERNGNYITYFDLNLAINLKNVGEILNNKFQGLKKMRMEMYVCSGASINILNLLINLMSDLRRLHIGQIRDETSQSIVLCMNQILGQIKGTETMDVICYYDLPNRVNHLMTLPTDIRIYELFEVLADKYKNPILDLKFDNEYNQKIIIDRQEILDEAIRGAINKAINDNSRVCLELEIWLEEPYNPIMGHRLQDNTYTINTVPMRNIYSQGNISVPGMRTINNYVPPNEDFHCKECGKKWQVPDAQEGVVYVCPDPRCNQYILERNTDYDGKFNGSGGNNLSLFGNPRVVPFPSHSPHTTPAPSNPTNQSYLKRFT